LFKPIRPKEVDNVLKKYHEDQIPYFFKYAKKKEDKEINPNITDCTMHKIMNEIKDNKLIFNSIRRLPKIDYKMFLRDKECLYSNDNINDIYDRENKIYGHNLKLDVDDTNKNNFIIVAEKIKEKLFAIEPDEYKVIQSLVKHLYDNSSTRKKKLLWYLFGEELLNNIKNNIDENKINCMQCGARVVREDLIRYKCKKCREKEIKHLGGKKIIKCADCGKEFEVESKNTKTIRCKCCTNKHRKEWDRDRKR